MQRYLIIGGIVVALIAGGLAVYFIFFANQPSVTVDTPVDDGSLPVAGNTPPGNGGEVQQPVSVPGQPEKITPKLVKIDVGPVVTGAVAYNTAVSSSSPTSDVAISYLQRESGNVFQYLVHASTLTRISNRTIPGVQEAKWLPDGSTAFVRYLSGEDHSIINTYALPSSGTSGYFLAQSIDGLSVTSGSLLTLASSNTGSVGTTMKPDGSNSKRAFTTPLGMVRTSFAGKGQYLVFNKPSGTLPGYVFLVNGAGQFARVAGPLKGLAALASPSGAWVLVSYTSGETLAMSLIETATGKSIALPVGSIVDKCAWAPLEDSVYCGIPNDLGMGFMYPDDWYQGAASFSDKLWKIDVEGRFAELVLDFTKVTTEKLDATALTMDQKGTVLVFKNKNDGSLWSFEL